GGCPRRPPAPGPAAAGVRMARPSAGPVLRARKEPSHAFSSRIPRYATRLSTNRHSFLVRITPPHYAGGWTTLIRPMYRYDHHDQRLVDERVSQFGDQTRRFLAGELTEDEFRPLRLRNGLYIQKYAPMLRISIP